MPKIGMSLFAGVVMLSAIACDDGVADSAENAGRCRKICNALEECTGNESETDQCREECKDESVDDDYERKAEECSECVDGDNSCSENAFQCADECAGVIAGAAL